jgi:hypothetical protein
MQLVCMYVDVAGIQLSTRATSGTDTAERGNMPQILVKWLMGDSYSASLCHCVCCSDLQRRHTPTARAQAV